MNSNIDRFVLGVAVAVMLFVAPVSSNAFNEYDKVLHFGVSGVFGAASETILHYNTNLNVPQRIASSTFLGIIPGIFKELYDDRQKDNSFDWGDMAANTGGAFVGAVISNYVNDKIQVSIDNNVKGAKVSYKFEF